MRRACRSRRAGNCTMARGFMRQDVVKADDQQAFFSRRNVRSMIVMLSFIFTVRWSVASPYEVPTPSMEPSIKVGDRVLGNHLAYRLRFPFTNFTVASWGAPERGDIIIFKSQTEANVNLVKRVVAVAGDAVR